MASSKWVQCYRYLGCMREPRRCWWYTQVVLHAASAARVLPILSALLKAPFVSLRARYFVLKPQNNLKE
jgi:hypothetical protein